MGDYDAARRAAIRNSYRAAIKELVARYRPGRPTVVMLPGGMGSQLDRSPEPWTGSSEDVACYDPIWLDSGIFFESDGTKLEIDPDGRDIGGHIVVPNGPLRYLVHAYAETERWAAASGINYVVFGYDWRRSLEEAADHLDFFLDAMRDAIMHRCGEDPLPTTTLLGHSQGGLVAKVFLHEVGGAAAKMARLITVGTPFYGTWSHQQRFYVGQSPLNAIYGIRNTARIIATLPGPYILMFLDREAFDRDHARLGFAGPDDYPITNAISGAPCDPFADEHLGRYPPWVSRFHIAAARETLRKVAAPLPDAVAERVHCIRSALDKQTPTRLRWEPVPADFDPGVRYINPIKTKAPRNGGGGDNTVPAWSAWHAHVPRENCIDLKRARVHGDLLQHTEVLDAVGRLVNPSYVPYRPPPRSDAFARGEETMSLSDLEDFAADIGTGRARRSDPRAHDERTWKRMMTEMLV